MINAIHQLDDNHELKTTSHIRRSRLEKLMDVIQATAMGPAKPTQVMKLANIPHNEFKQLVKTLEKKEMVDSKSSFSGKLFIATNYGLQVLKDYQGVRSRLLDT
ncbi:MAG: winged helix-turn-helix domain-containing protein, partial [Nitrososphaerales archaeon]